MITNELKQNNLTYQRSHPKTIVQIKHIVCWNLWNLGKHMNFGQTDKAKTHEKICPFTCKDQLCNYEQVINCLTTSPWKYQRRNRVSHPTIQQETRSGYKPWVESLMSKLIIISQTGEILILGLPKYSKFGTITYILKVIIPSLDQRMWIQRWWF